MSLWILGSVSDEQRTLRIDWVQTAAGALTAVSSAVLLSTVGVAGTIIGAAVGSVVATVGNAVYGHYLRLSKERVAAARALAVAQAQSPAGRTARTHVDVVERARVPWRQALSGLPWRRIVPVTLGVFLLAMTAITVFELTTGRAVSTYTGGSSANHARTSIPGLGSSGGAGRAATPSPSRQPSDAATGATGSPASPAPSADATPQTAPEAPVPTTATVTTPSAAPSGTPGAASQAPSPATGASPTPSASPAP